MILITPGSIPQEAKRFCLFDGVGYFRSYETRRRAIQGLRDVSRFYKSWIKMKNVQFALYDQFDKGVSYF